MDFKKNQIVDKKSRWTKGIEKIHPFKTLLFLGSIAISLIFVFLMFSFWLLSYDYYEQLNLSFTKGFSLSALFLPSVALIAIYGKNAFKDENFPSLSFQLRSIILLSNIYLLISLWAWRSFFEPISSIQEYPGISFLFLASGLHFLHLVGGLIWSVVIYARLGSKASDPVKRLIYFTNPYERLQIELLFQNWVWICGIGLGIFLFLISSF